MLAAQPAWAFQIQTPVTAGCHEEITLGATADAGFPDVATAPAATEDQHRAMDDLTFSLPHRDVWTLALLFGVRSNDVRDQPPTAIARLGDVHNDPDDQQAHCLRRPADDGPDGDAAAIAACRQFVLAELAAGHLLDDDLDTASAEPVSVYLAIRGKVTIELPAFAYHLGRALHAIQDGYTHVFRDDAGAITHVLNWVDYIDDYREARDGYHHVGALDDCRRDDVREERRVARAREASRLLVAAIADPAPGRRARIEAALDTILARMPGCDLANRYCAAPELDEEASYSTGCAAAGGSLAIALVVVAFALRRRRALVLALVVAPAVARAEPVRWHLDAKLGASLDETAAASSVGIGGDLGRWTAGLHVEWNPWFSLDAERAVPGSFNTYVSLARRWYVRPELAIYSRAELGTSTILFELVGIDRYTTGVYYGGVIVGLRIPVRRCIDLTFDPSHLAMPTPKLFGSGFPYYYGQWRVTVGLEARL